jgi:hypothetical protein
MRKKPLVLLCLVGTTLAVAPLVLLGGGKSNESRDPAGDLREILTECGGNYACLGAGIEGKLGSSLRGDDTATVVAELVGELRTSENAGALCHLVAHTIGRTLGPALQDRPDIRLGENWNVCSFGILHGAYENLELPRDPEQAGVKSYASCVRGEVSERMDRFSSCIHSIGHALHTTFDGNIPKAEVACESSARAGQQVSRPELAPVNTLHFCLRGVYMLDLDSRVTAETKLDTVSRWEEAMSHCLASPAPDQCAYSYAEAAVERGDDAMRAYKDWCVGIGGRAGECVTFLGQHLGPRGLRDEVGPSRCGELGDNGEETASCVEGSRQGLRGVIASKEEADRALCRMLEDTGISCENSTEEREPGS